MKKLTTTLGLAAILSTGAFAGAACDGFQLKIQNNTSDDLLLHKIVLHGAKIQPDSLGKLNSHKAQVYVINSSADNVPMSGEFIYHTASLPSKKVIVKYELKNAGPICEHTDVSPVTDLNLDKTRGVNQVQYNIDPK